MLGRGAAWLLAKGVEAGAWYDGDVETPDRRFESLKGEYGLFELSEKGFC